MPEIEDTERPKAHKLIIDTVSQVVRYASPYKNEAIALLKKYKPSAAVKAEEIARLTFQDVMGRADDAIYAHEWDRAIILLKAAVNKVNPIREIDNLNLARYNLAFCYFMNKQYYESDHPGRAPGPPLSEGRIVRQGDGDRDAGAGGGLQYLHGDRSGADLDRLVNLATYTAETWPDRDEGDDARLNLGLI